MEWTIPLINSLLVKEKPENIKVSVNSKKDIPKLRTDFHLLKRVFSNLFLNAIQAMPNGGQLTISIQSTDDHVIISVKDTGVGIPEKSVSKIFEPFFTTKAQGQGLGLSICKKFVEANMCSKLLGFLQCKRRPLGLNRGNNNVLETHNESVFGVKL